MNIPEATDALKPGDSYVFYSRKNADEKLKPEQLGPPEQDGVVVQYRNIIIRSDLVTTPEKPAPFLAWIAIQVFAHRETLTEALDAIDEHLKP